MLITPGKGSSGEYTEEILEAAAEMKAFPAGTKDWFKHKEWRGEQRDPRDQWGFLLEDARYEEGVGLVAPIKILSHWVDVVESLAEEGQAELSIYAAAAINEDTDEIVAILPATSNSIDLVDHPGRPGSRLAQKIERARESYTPAAASAEEKKKETHMDEKERKALAAELAAALAESLKPFVDFVTNAKTAEEKAAQAEVEASVVESAVTKALDSYEEQARAIREAKLFPSQEADLLAEARKGNDVTEALAKAVKVVEEAKAQQGDEPGSTFTIERNDSGSSKKKSFYLTGTGA
ncbi:hypothetical protein [Agromyces larvae]|uniref:DUF2213 domain-containing protein n=1 Tax=Agromyces larvae TaxID=2929802 RepID=A0ABY4C3D8_9MICO|nr:hypothetical protein [Agromyces larvae]UOE45981.1 hypothetical protein MTO99_09630 [Agromyces larvae]